MGAPGRVCVCLCAYVCFVLVYQFISSICSSAGNKYLDTNADLLKCNVLKCTYTLRYYQNIIKLRNSLVYCTSLISVHAIPVVFLKV